MPESAADPVAAYLAGLPDSRRGEVERLHRVITRTAPELSVKLWDYGGGLIGYGEYHYRTRSGLEGDWFMVGLGNRKSYVSLYSMAIKDGDYLTAAYAARFSKTKLGKSCFNIRQPELVEDDLVAEVVRETVAYFENRVASG